LIDDVELSEPAAGDDELDPAIKPKNARAWLAQIRTAQVAFEDYQNRADNIDKLYGDLSKLANVARDRQFQLFWANIQVLGPSIYSRPPVPVVVPRFKDRRPLYRVASEMLERASVVGFEQTDIDSVMKLIRDDLNISGRGVPWVRYETKADSETATERACIEFKDRKDFLHEPVRYWPEVGWVAGAGYLTKRAMRKRFSKSSGNAYQDAAYTVRKDDKENGAADNRAKAKVWEIWSKDENRVVWVTEGVDVLLDDAEPHLKLEGFFPCPRPAYATLQRRSLVPVPDIVYYRDQLEEVNQLTSRIHALADALKVRGFYPAGVSEIGEAVETAIKSNDDRQMLVPISNWAAFGSSSGEPVVWWPLENVVQAVTSLVELRKQVINDVYEIVGLSDIMRGSTEASETATAQQLKSQYGSVRIRDKQAELVRVARDLTKIAAEIMAENFSPDTLLSMSQMEIPTDADIKQQTAAIMQQAEQQFQQQLQQAQSNPELMQQAQQNPEQAQQVIEQARQQIIGQAKAQIDKLQQTPTVEEVMKLLRDQKLRPFVLDIETDSTIQPDEDAEKQRRTEFMQVLGGTLQQLGQLVAVEPGAATFAGEVLKFAVAPFRAGRELEGAIEEFADQMAQKAGQPSPQQQAEQKQADAEEKRSQTEMQMKQAELQQKAQIEEAKLKADQEDRQIERQAKQEEAQAKIAIINAQAARDDQKHQADMQLKQMELDMKAAEMQFKRESAEIDAAARQHQADLNAQSAEQQAQIKSEQAEQQMAHANQAFQQKSALQKEPA